MIRLFVYGTLRGASGHPMGHYLATHAGHEGEAILGGADLFDLGQHPGATVPGTGRVLGDVYALHPTTADEVMARLDDYEGCGPGDPPPHHYTRHRLRVTRRTGEEVTAWVYLLQIVPAHAVPVPSGDYLGWRESRRPPG